jgi:hypothetical protein
MALINRRGTLIAATLKTWKIIVGGNAPYAQPTGSAHGLIAVGGWTLVEGEIWYRASDGLRAFSGADGVYQTLPVEWLFRATPPTLSPKTASNYASEDVLCFYQNCVYDSYISASNYDYRRYRLVFDTLYKRFRQDDIAATAMLWEPDTNVLLVGKQISATSYGVAQDWTNDYDDGGWDGGLLIQVPISLTIQLPYRDLGKPHFGKEWNVYECDANTAGQNLETTLLFLTEPPQSLTLPAESTSQREKIQYQIEEGAGYGAYSMSILHQMSVTTAPTLFQENIYAVLLADYRTSYDTYLQKFGTDLLKLVKDGYFDYSALAQVTIQLFADGSNVPYFVDDSTLIPQTSSLTFAPTRSSVRVQFPAKKCRLWRMILTSPQSFQLWSAVQIEVKPLEEGSGYSKAEFAVYE